MGSDQLAGSSYCRFKVVCKITNGYGFPHLIHDLSTRGINSELC